MAYTNSTGPFADVIARLQASEVHNPSFGERFGVNAADAFLELLKGVSQPFKPKAGREENFLTRRNPLSALFGNLQQQLPNLEEPTTTGQKIAKYAGAFAPDIALGIATAPLAVGTTRILAARGVHPLLSLLGGEAAQSLALLPADLAREDRSTLGAAGAAVGGAAAGTALGALFGGLNPLRVIGGQAELRNALKGVPDEVLQEIEKQLASKRPAREVAKSDAFFDEFFGRRQAAKVKADHDFFTEPVFAGRPLAEIRDAPVPDPLELLKQSRAKLRNKPITVVKGANTTRAEFDRIAHTISVVSDALKTRLGEDTPPARWMNEILSGAIYGAKDVEKSAGGVRGGGAYMSSRLSSHPSLSKQAFGEGTIELGNHVGTLEGAQRVTAHEFGHHFVEKAIESVPHRVAQVYAEREAMDVIRMLRIVRESASPVTELRELSRVSNSHPIRLIQEWLGYDVSRLRRGIRAERELRGISGEAAVKGLPGGSAPLRRDVLEAKLERMLKNRMDSAANAKAMADALREGADDFTRGADDFMLILADGVRSHPLRPTGVAFPGTNRATVEWGIEEGMADMIEALARTEQFSEAGYEVPARILEALRDPASREAMLIRQGIQGDLDAQREVMRKGLQGVAADAAGEQSIGAARSSLGPEGVEMEKIRMLIGKDAPVQLTDGRVIYPGSAEAGHLTESIINRKLLTRDEYIQRLHDAFVEKGLKMDTSDELRAILKKTLSRKPFRSVAASERFQIDTLVAQKLKEIGFPRQEARDIMTRMTLAEREALALKYNVEKFVGNAGLHVLEDLGQHTPPMINAAMAQDFLDMVADAKAPISLQSFWDRMIFLRNGNLLLHPATYMGNLVATLAHGAQVPARSVVATGLDAVRSALPELTVKGAKITGGERLRELQDVWPEFHGWMSATMNSLGGMTSRSRTLPSDLLQNANRFRLVREGLERPNPFGAGKLAPRRLLSKETFLDELGRTVSKPAEFAYKSLSTADQWMFDNAFMGRISAEAARVGRKTGRATEDVLTEWGGALRNLAMDAKATVDAETKAALDKGGKAAAEAIKLEDPRHYQAAVDRMFRDMTAARPDLLPVVNTAAFADKLIFTAREGAKLDKLLDHITQNAFTRNALDPFIPFRRTAANIAREAVRSSPVGLLTSWSRFLDNLATSRGVVEALQQTAKMEPEVLTQMMAEADQVAIGQLMDDLSQAVVGTAIGGGLLALTASGLIKYQPFDREMPRNERLLREKAGQGTESIIAGGVSVPVYRLPPPVAESIRGIQSMLDARKQGADITQAAATGMLSFLGNLTDETFLQGLDGLVQTIRDPARAGVQFAGSFSGSFIPRVIQPKEYADLRPEKGEPPLQAALKALAGGPLGKLGLTETQVGPLGERRVRTDILGSGIRFATNDPLVQELVSREVFPTLGLPRDLALSKAQENDALQAKGQLQREILSSIIASEGYQRIGDPALKRAMLVRALRKVNTQANKLIKARVARGMDVSFGALLDAFNIR